MIRWPIAFALVLLVQPATARVFDFKDENLAAYFRGGAGLSRVGKETFGKSSGNDTVFADEASYNFSGEFGFLFGLGPHINIRGGVEILQPKKLSEIKGKNASGTERFTLTSQVFILNPLVAIEAHYSQTATRRYFFFAGLGWADVSLDNAYTMTATGTTELGVADFTEKAEASVTNGFIGVGLETLFTDNVTFEFDVAYRWMPVTELKHKGSYTTIAQGSVSKGDVVRNDDGSQRNFDMSGLIMNMSFRFYINFL